MTRMTSLPSLDRLILGTNPLSGVDHFSADRAREKKLNSSVEHAVSVILRSVESGARGLSLDVSTGSEFLIEALRSRDLSHPIGLYPIVPDSDMVPTVLNRGPIAALGAIRERAGVGGAAHAVLGGAKTALTGDPSAAMRAYLDIVRQRIARWESSRIQVKSLVLHEIVADALLGLNASELTNEFVNHVSKKFGIWPSFVTRNFSHFVDWSDYIGLPKDHHLIFTPFNPLGFQMTPSRTSSELALLAAKPTRVYAISPLAGGQVLLSEGLQYLAKQRGLAGVVLGVSSLDHAFESFSQATDLFRDVD